MKQRVVVLLLVGAALGAALPVAADTVKASVGPGADRFWGFLPPIGGAQAVVTLTWKQHGSTALVILGCDDGSGGAIVYGASANLNLDRTARVEGGVLGDACLVGVAGFGGRVSFVMNVDAEADSTSTTNLREEGAALRSRLVPISRADVPAAFVAALDALVAGAGR